MSVLIRHLICIASSVILFAFAFVFSAWFLHHGHRQSRIHKNHWIIIRNVYKSLGIHRDHYESRGTEIRIRILWHQYEHRVHAHPQTMLVWVVVSGCALSLSLILSLSLSLLFLISISLSLDLPLSRSLSLSLSLSFFLSLHGGFHSWGIYVIVSALWLSLSRSFSLSFSLSISPSFCSTLCSIFPWVDASGFVLSLCLPLSPSLSLSESFSQTFMFSLALSTSLEYEPSCMRDMLYRSSLFGVYVRVQHMYAAAALNSSHKATHRTWVI